MEIECRITQESSLMIRENIKYMINLKEIYLGSKSINKSDR